MKRKILFLFLGLFLLTVVRADSSSFQINFIVPSDNPIFTNLANYTSNVNESFYVDVDATDTDGISCFTLNDTSTFNVDCSGVITNITTLDSVTVYTLNITVNDTLNYQTSEVFYINISYPIPLGSLIRIYPDDEGLVPHVILGNVQGENLPYVQLGRRISLP